MSSNEAPPEPSPSNMQRNGHTLSEYSRNVNSQSGEDGIVEEVLMRIGNAGATDGWCAEFGAWDGIYLSNTYHLINDKGFKAVLIEGDARKYQTLCRNIPRADVHKICEFITFEGKSTLDNVLATTPIPSDFDFLSIDIDGCDYFIFESLQKFKPKIICIEYNPSIPNEVEFIQPKNFAIKQGASARSLVELANAKGYALVAVTATNLILVRSELAAFVVAPTPGLESLRDDSQIKTFLFVGYDGTVLSNRGELKLWWHGLKLYTATIQMLPRVLRAFPADYTWTQKILFSIWSTIRKPAAFIDKLVARSKQRP